MGPNGLAQHTNTNSAGSLADVIDPAYAPAHSIVLRYRHAFRFAIDDADDAAYKDHLVAASIREGARVLHLFDYRGVHLFVLDETTRMHTRTMRSIDGCVTTAWCRHRGYDRVVFESGGNTGTALSAYGHRAGIETFFFLPAENVPLLRSDVFAPETAHLLAVEAPGMVKPAGKRFYTAHGLPHVPEVPWRYAAARFRGFFLLEHMLAHGRFDWVSQTISAAFGPIGIYQVLAAHRAALGELPRFLGVQQASNCPMYRAWRKRSNHIEPVEIASTDELLTRILYDVRPHTYGTFDELMALLATAGGAVHTVNRSTFDAFLTRDFDGHGLRPALAAHGIDLPMRDGEVIEKTGLIALMGTLQAIDEGLIAPGAKVLCCLTSGMTDSDGAAVPDLCLRTDTLDAQLAAFGQRVAVA